MEVVWYGVGFYGVLVLEDEGVYVGFVDDCLKMCFVMLVGMIFS